MGKLLAIEWLKIKNYRTFWVLSGLFGVLMIFWNYSISAGFLKLGGNINIVNTSYAFPAVWGNIAFWTKLFTGLLAVLIVILTTNEYQFKTNRQNVIEGWQRSEFFHAKWLVILVISAGVTAFAFLEGVVFSAFNGGDFSRIFEQAQKLLYVFLLTLNYFGFAFTLSLFTKKSGMSIMIFLAYNYFIEIIVSQILNWKFSGHVGSFLPMQCSADLIQFPAMEIVRKMIAQNGPTEAAMVVASVAWIVIYYAIGRVKLLRTDW